MSVRAVFVLFVCLFVCFVCVGLFYFLCLFGMCVVLLFVCFSLSVLVCCYCCLIVLVSLLWFVCFLFVVLACSGIRALPRQGHARRALRRGNFCLFLGVVLFCLFILACLLALFARVVCLFVCCFCFVDGLSVCFFLYA